MNETTGELAALEPERYELHAAESEARAWEAARREFFQFVGGGGIVVVFTLDEAPVVAVQKTGTGRRRGPGESLPREIGAWLHVGGEDGSVTAYVGKVEVGQNIRTSLTQVIADELSLPRASVRLVMGDTDLAPFDSGTAGSRTTPITSPQLRKIARAARDVLLDLAAARPGSAERASLDVENGAVVDRATGRRFPFNELTRNQKILRAASQETDATSPQEWRAAGTSAPKVDGRAFVTGQHWYTSDLKRPGQWYGKVLRPPFAGAERVSLDTSAAEAMPGVTGVTVVRDGDFVGVAAVDEQTAARALSAIRAQWKPAGEPQPSNKTLFDYLKNHPAEVPGYGHQPAHHTVGSIADGLAAADYTLEETYTIAYIAHAPPEPRAAIAEWGDDGRLTVWTGTQRPFGVRAELAGALEISEERIRVIVPDTGSGYGGKHTGEAAVEAARLAKGANRPVKLVWTREEEFRWAYLRPAGVIELRSGVRSDGVLTAWECRNVNSGASGIRTPYTVANQNSEFHPAQSPLRQGSYRALAATANHFARESHLDELARAVGMDPLAFRRKNLEDDRLRAVLDAAAERFGWENANEARAHHGWGIAGGHEKGSYVATCAEVAVEPATGEVKILRAVTAFECGAIINPGHLRAQVEGAVIMGIGGALFEQIVFANGVIQNACFSQYRLPRFGDVPPILETVLLDRKDLPSLGAGETPIVAIAPAIGNAIFHATGIRLRSLPMAPGGVKTA